jgi:hypothetical protein
MPLLPLSYVRKQKIHVILRAHSISGHNQLAKSRWLIKVVALNSNMILVILPVRKARGRTKRCWAMSLHMEVCWQPNISSTSLTCINHWSRFVSNGWGASLRRYKKKTVATLGGCVSKRSKSKPRTWLLLLWEGERAHKNTTTKWEEGKKNKRWICPVF